MVNFQQNIPLGQFTTLKIGGPSKYFCVVSSKAELIEALEYAKEHNLDRFILGGGSNLLISDEGFPGLVIKNEIQGISFRGSTPNLIVGSGTKLQELVDFTVANGLSGIQKLTGIYGTVGGAVFGNTGAYGQTISDHLIKVVCLRDGKIVVLNNKQCEFGYRDSVFKKNGDVILEVHFKFPTGNGKNLQQESQEISVQRQIKFPPSLKCPGSFFKNIPLEKIPENTLKLIPKDKITFNKVASAVLLEAVGAKGRRVGDTQVSQNHANLIINLGKGKSSDFHTLASSLIKDVYEKFGVQLEPEVQLINLPLLSGC